MCLTLKMGWFQFQVSLQFWETWILTMRCFSAFNVPFPGKNGTMVWQFQATKIGSEAQERRIMGI